jgi:hypothetical protein
MTALQLLSFFSTIGADYDFIAINNILIYLLSELGLFGLA